MTAIKGIEEKERVRRVTVESKPNHRRRPTQTLLTKLGRLFLVTCNERHLPNSAFPHTHIGPVLLTLHVSRKTRACCC
eukprot:3904418-Pleurochrysis_carterae.AAC.1